MPRVLLVNMPFSNLRWPNIGPSLLKAGLNQHGIDCDIAYLNFDFAERLSLDDYYWIADHFAFVLGGERLFAGHYFDRQLPNAESYYRNILLKADATFESAERQCYEDIAKHIAPFLDHCMSTIDWSKYAIVGFTTSFQQTMASVCLTQRIKELKPDMQIVFGGAACENEMGIELIRQFPMIDYVFLGEADRTFPPVVEAILSGKAVGPMPGVVGRDGIQATCDGRSFRVHNMDDLPYPNYDDYFQKLNNSTLASQIVPLLFFESSRGCWWGEKHHCVFCGLNGDSLTFRSKSPQRAARELLYLADRYDVRNVSTSDNILDARYFDTFLPALKEANANISFGYEMRTNLKRSQVTTLLEAGLGSAQLGIETFSTSILKLMNKGVRGIQNLQVLKWFSEAGIDVRWNFLYGFPGEDPADYEPMATLMQSLVHLIPPSGVGRVRLDRFSPYFDDPTSYGMSNPRPNDAFHYVFPFDDAVLNNLAYYYEYDYADGRNPLEYVAPVLEALGNWQQLHDTVTFRYWDRPDGVLLLTDTRPFAAMFQRRLSHIERSIYLFCDTARSEQDILKFVSNQPENRSTNESTIKSILAEWTAEQIMAKLDNRYLSLAMRVES